MKKQAKLGTLACVLCAVLALPSAPAEAGGAFGMHIGSGGFGVSVGIGDWGPYTSSWANAHYTLDFNATLSGYGEWVWVGNLGRVWRPWVAVDWRPYTHGRWVRTSLGWTWVAYEPWGYVPHHYGSWAMCDFGWVWVPGYSYVSANVVWVRSGGYVGWYARPPRGWSHAAHSYRHGYRDGYRDGWHDARYATYVDWHHMPSDNVAHYAVRHNVAAHGRIENHAAAPTVDEVRRRGGVTVTESRLSQRTVTVDGRRLTVARPEGVARSIEQHASRTAAEALSPRALERRQPSVRADSSASRTRSGATDIPRNRSLDAGSGFRAPGQQERGGSPAMADRRVHERTTRDTAAATAPPSRSFRGTRSVDASRRAQSQRSPVSVRGRASSAAAGSHRARAPESSPGSSASGSSTRISSRSPRAVEPTAGRSDRRVASTPRRSAPQRTGAGPASQGNATRTRSAGRAVTGTGPSGDPPNARRRSTAPRNEDAPESKPKPTRRSTASRKR